MTQEQTRLHKIEILLDLVKQCGETGLDPEKTAAQFGLKYGTSRRTFMEYKKTLILMERIKEMDGLLYANQS